MHRSAPRVVARAISVSVVFVLTVLTFATGSAGAADADRIQERAERAGLDFVTPIFGLGLNRGALFVADSGQGIVRVGPRGGRSLVAELPGVTDVAPYRRRAMHAITGATDSMYFRVRRGVVRPVADLGAFEARVNPDRGEIDSNPFNVARLRGRRALVADAAANALLRVGRHGHVDWVATLPDQLVPTRNAKRIAGCPDAEPDLAFVCDLPRRIPAEAVATSVAVGPDGAYYVGELKGFPAPKGRSRIWRIEPGSRHVRCGIDPGCSVAARGFTSIVDLDFAPDGTLYVVELDEESWLAAEFGLGSGGTVNACDIGAADCSVLTRLPLPTAVAANRLRIYATTMALVPGEADVVRIG